jgi:GAF domain-containing protein
VFDAMLQNAIRICEASYGNIYRWDGQNLRLEATRNAPVAYAEFRKRSSLQDSPNMRRVLATKTFVHLIDAKADAAYTERRDLTLVAAVELAGLRTLLVVPLLNGDDLVGVFSLGRQEVRAFTDKQIALVTNFAAQAVIAIENARLLSELRESLEEQTATSDVLKVISSSPGDLEPVFAAMLEKAARICDAAFGNIFRRDGDALHLVSRRATRPRPAYSDGINTPAYC